ncbi:MAG: L-histidine N(alpha)-methyltransferase, partial [Gammaproteobacteria bacterium]
QGLDLPASPGAANKLAFFPGSSIGNFEPREAETFLKDVGKHLRPNDAMLLGIDLKKDPAVLHAAYNDDASVTARFNLNLLTRIKRELGSDLEPENFEHRALYDESKGRVEMHLVSRRAQQVSIAGQTFAFAEGESIHTENSYKYTVAEFQSLASRAGYSPERVWTDADEYFSVHYLRFGRR